LNAGDWFEWQGLKLLVDEIYEGAEKKEPAGLRLESIGHDYLRVLDC